MKIMQIILTQLVVCNYQLSGHRLKQFLKIPVFTFSHRKPLIMKIDLAVKKVKVNPGSSFEQTMMGWST